MIPKVTVVVPVYGSKNKLRQCFNSLVNQTLKDIEIILVEDGYHDEEVSQICDEYKADSRVIVIHQENHGAGYAINRGIDMAHGEYIAEADCDDIVELDAYEQLYNLADGCDVIKGGYTAFTSDGLERKVMLWPEEWDGVVHCPLQMQTEDQLRLIGTTCAMWCALYRKEFLDREGIRMRETAGALFQDTAFTLKTKILPKTFKTVNIPVYRYRIDNDESSTHNISNPYALNDEYADVEGMLKERGISIWTVWSRIKFGGYTWMLGMIDYDQKKPYIFKIREDMKDEAFNPAFFDKLQWHVLTNWMINV